MVVDCNHRWGRGVHPAVWILDKYRLGFCHFKDMDGARPLSFFYSPPFPAPDFTQNGIL